MLCSLMTNNVYCASWGAVSWLRSVVDCHPIDSLYQSIVGITVSYVNTSASTTYGSQVTATCRRGTVAVGDTVWQCDHNGLWSTPVNFQCHSKLSMVIHDLLYEMCLPVCGVCLIWLYCRREADVVMLRYVLKCISSEIRQSWRKLGQ